MASYRSFPRLMRAAIHRNDQGIALPMVLVVFLVGFALVGAFLVAIVGSATVSNTTRSGIQAQAAADAGIAAVHAAVNPCATPFPLSSSGSVRYSTSVVCDLNSVPPKATIKSKGSAPDGTVANVESVVPLNVKTSGGAVPLYTAENLSLGGNADIQAVSSTEPADLYVDGRNFTCDGSAAISGSVFVTGGTAEISGACVVQGDVKATGNVTVNGGGKVDGTIESQGSVTLSGWNGILADEVRASGNVSLDGSAKAVTVNAGGSLTMSGNTRVEVATYRTTVNLSGTASIGSKSQAPVTVAAPPTPPPFPEMTKAAILAAHPSPTWELATWSGGCSIGGTHVMKTLIQNATKPIIIDAMSCAKVSFESNSTLVVPKDITIISQAFDLGTYNLESANSTVNTLRFMVPFEQPCAGGAGKITTNNFKFSTSKPLLALAYSRCGVSLGNGSNAYWPGTVLTKNLTGTPLMKYSPVSLDPSKPNGGSGAGAVTTISISGPPVSQRNIE